MAEKFNLSVILKLRDEASGKMTRFGSVTKKIGQGLLKFGKQAAVAGVVAGGVFTGLAIRKTEQFQSTMNMVGAVTNSTAEEFKSLSSLAKELGATTQFSATDAAEAMKFMGMAGLETNLIIGSSADVLQLAAAAQLDMASAADIVTNVLKGYGIETKDLAHANDVLVDTFTNANVNLPQLGQSMRKVGPLASSLGISFEDTAAAIGALGNAGIQAEEAGTGLKTVLARLLSPSKNATKVMDYYELSFRNANGTVKNFSGIVGEFENAIRKGADETELAGAAVEIFGTRGIQIIQALLKTGGKGIDDLSAKLGVKNEDGLGSSARVAKAQMERLPGAFKLIKSSFEAIELAFGESPIGGLIEKGMRDAATAMREFSKILPGLIDEMFMEFDRIPKMFDGFFDGASEQWAVFVSEWNAEWSKVWNAIPAPIREWLEGSKVDTIRVSKLAPADVSKAGGMGDVAMNMIKAFQGKNETLTERVKTSPSSIPLSAFSGRGFSAAGGAAAEIVIKVEAEKGSSARVQEMNKTGSIDLKVETRSDVGLTMGNMGFVVPGAR